MRLECATDVTPSTSSNFKIESSSGSCNTSSTYDVMLSITPHAKRIKRDLNLFTVAAFVIEQESLIELQIYCQCNSKRCWHCNKRMTIQI